VTVDKIGGVAVSEHLYWLWKFVSYVSGPGTMQDGVCQTMDRHAVRTHSRFYG